MSYIFSLECFIHRKRFLMVLYRLQSSLRAVNLRYIKLMNVTLCTAGFFQIQSHITFILFQLYFNNDECNIYVCIYAVI